MKPYKYVLPVLAVAALGLSFSALAGQAESSKEGRKPEVKVGPVSVMSMAQNSVPPAPPTPLAETTLPSLPTITIEGVDSEDLQKVLNEALSFKGSDAEFAKKSAEWKSKFGVTVTRKGQGRVTLTKGEGNKMVRVEIHRPGGSLDGRKAIAPRTGSLDATERVRVLSPDSKVFRLTPGKELKLDLKDLAEVKTMSPKERAEFEKAMSEMRKGLSEIEGVRIILPDIAELRSDSKLSPKERAKLEKELSEMRKEMRALPGLEGRALFEFDGLETTGPEFRVFGFGADVKGLSATDRKKMNEEIAKVRAESEKKISSIMKKYQEKAKKADK